MGCIDRIVSILLYCYYVPSCICWLGTEDDSFRNLWHRLLKLQVICISMCSKFSYHFTISGCQNVTVIC
jgi:hypothetical protein